MLSNASRGALTETSTLHDAVGEWTRTKPESIAVVCGENRYTYGDLDLMANSYADDLASLGVEKGSVVPLRMARSVEFVATMLAVLRLGATYAVIDLRWPADRARKLVSQVSAPLLVGERYESSGQSVLSWWPQPGARKESRRTGDAATTGTDPYSVLFTSGSTGMPKGVVLPQQGLLRLFAAGSPLPVTEDMVITQCSALPWDLAAFELWAPLVSGGTLVLVEDPFLTGRTLSRLIRSDGVNTVSLATSVFKLLVEEDVESFRGLRHVLVVGEALPSRHCSQFLAAHPGIELINLYGPLECGVFATMWRVTEADCADAEGIPIGVALPATDVYVLDGARECAAGEVGEILLGGCGLAQGYLGDPELTAAKFVWLEVDGRRRRLYRTGDLALRDERGVLYFKGRADRQIKVRGNRVEPEEVEAILSRAPGVRACAVIPCFDGNGACDSLAACYVAPAEVTAEELRRYMSANAPAYQVPGEFLRVDSIPLTANGKVDSAAVLKGIAFRRQARVAAAGNAGQSHDRLLREITEMVADCLGISPEAVQENTLLLDLGAHSIDLSRIAARVGNALCLTVPISVMYQAGTVAEIAGWARGQASVKDVAKAAAPSPGHPVMSDFQSFFMTDHLRDSKSLDYHCIFAWVTTSAVDRPTLIRSFQAIHRRYEALQSRYTFARGPRIIVDKAMPPPEVVLGRAADLAGARREIINICRRPLSPRSGNVWFPFVIEIADGAQAVFGLCVHHVAFDGTSMRVLARDLGDIYQQAQCGIEPSLEKSPAMLTVSEVSAERRAAIDMAAQQDDWRKMLADISPLPLPAAEPMSSEPIGQIKANLGVNLHRGILWLSRKLSVTPFAVYLSAYAQALGKETDTPDLGVVVPVDQRADDRIRDAVGCIVSLTAVRLSVRPDLDSPDAIQEASGAVARAFRTQDVFPFGNNPGFADPGQLARAFRTLFALQDTMYSQVQLGSGTAELFDATYVSLPAYVEIITEVIPRYDGSAVLYLHHRSGISRDFCERLAAATVHNLELYAACGYSAVLFAILVRREHEPSRGGSHWRGACFSSRNRPRRELAYPQCRSLGRAARPDTGRASGLVLLLGPRGRLGRAAGAQGLPQGRSLRNVCPGRGAGGSRRRWAQHPRMGSQPGRRRYGRRREQYGALAARV